MDHNGDRAGLPRENPEKLIERLVPVECPVFTDPQQIGGTSYPGGYSPPIFSPGQGDPRITRPTYRDPMFQTMIPPYLPYGRVGSTVPPLSIYQVPIKYIIGGQTMIVPVVSHYVTISPTGRLIIPSSPIPKPAVIPVYPTQSEKTILEATIVPIFTHYDVNRRGELDFHEFYSAIHEITTRLGFSAPPTMDEVGYYFQVFDQNKNGLISLSEFKTVLKDLYGIGR